MEILYEKTNSMDFNGVIGEIMILVFITIMEQQNIYLIKTMGNNALNYIY